MKIICVGRNYVDHAKELNNPVPTEPLLFMKPSTALLNNNKPFYHPEWSENIHYEAEVVLRICKNGKYIQPEFADTYFDQVSLGIDFTARDIQDRCKAKGHPWEIAKAFDHSAVIGPFISKLEIDPSSIHFQLERNGQVVQDGQTRDMIFSFADLIVYMSQRFTLQVGDFIYTGTPAGVGKVEIGDELVGRLEGREMFRIQVK
ncbi:MAG: fumarylacetoacetate hydrolase family protein [Saprospiraceae bacterium]|nr:fumarylacetoacetate hydrolase family protein [Saprospiraceae bacterium]